MKKHIKSCAQPEKVPCPTNMSLHNEGKDEHWWSGWPGAYCMKCGAEDKDEICIGNVCTCSCHDEFWKEYNESMERRKGQRRVIDCVSVRGKFINRNGRWQNDKRKIQRRTAKGRRKG